MKVNGIELLQMIYDKKITENNHISLINLVGGSLPLKWQYGMLYFSNDNEGRELEMFDLMNYTFEIIEEEKEIEEIEKDIEYIEHPEKEYPNRIEKKYYYDRDKMGDKINELVRELNKIKKEGK